MWCPALRTQQPRRSPTVTQPAAGSPDAAGPLGNTDARTAGRWRATSDLGVRHCRIPDHLPQMPVRVLEVSGVDAERAIVGRSCDARACRLGGSQERVNVLSAGHQLTNAERATDGRPRRDSRVLRKLTARIHRQDQTALEMEEGYRTSCVFLASGELCRDDSLGFKPQAIPIEVHGAVKVVNGQRDYVDSRSDARASSRTVTLCTSTRDLLIFRDTDDDAVRTVPANCRANS